MKRPWAKGDVVMFGERMCIVEEVSMHQRAQYLLIRSAQGGTWMGWVHGGEVIRPTSAQLRRALKALAIKAEVLTRDRVQLAVEAARRRR